MRSQVATTTAGRANDGFGWDSSFWRASCLWQGAHRPSLPCRGSLGTHAFACSRGLTPRSSELTKPLAVDAVRCKSAATLFVLAPGWERISRGRLSPFAKRVRGALRPYLALAPLNTTHHHHHQAFSLSGVTARSHAMPLF